jgi:phage baseplate assembly protein V
MTERFRNNEKNSPYRRGTVKEIKKGRIRVTFGDEDETDSFWLNANQGGTGANKSWSMPNVGEQVNCLIDWDGEDGCVLGSCWNSEDSAPSDDPGVEHIVDESGLEIIRDRKSGNITIKNAGSVRLEGADLVVSAETHLGGDGGKAVARIGDMVKVGSGSSAGLWPIIQGSSKVFAVD